MTARGLTIASILGIATLVQSPRGAAQNRGGAPAAAARASAPIDLTGYWVALITEDWRFRMVTPPKGDYRGVPITQEALKIVNAWDPAADEASGNQCKPYGAAAIMRVPGRLHVTWQDDETLRVDTDAGMQTRLFHFAASTPQGGNLTWQGQSSAQWERAVPGRGGMPAASSSGSGSLKVVTTNMRAGYLRRNGVPYSEHAVLTEYFDVAPYPAGGQVLLVTAVVDDPQYLQQAFITSSQFRKEADGSKWDPTPCSAKW
jgi:hypothetical protein